ncbi:fructose-bisphosphatase class II, partial [Candidatus Woesearchaeota archaeon]|nr:fructose-bisphosphatase class II [Candidatus Woesearchaeota archaeon]
EKARAKKMGMKDINQKLMMNDLVRSNEAMFAATGVTDGTILKGVSFLSHGAKTHSLVMRAKTKTIRFIEALHHFEHLPDY